MAHAPMLAEIRQLAHSAGLEGEPSPIPGGCGSWTYRLGAAWIVRVAQGPSTAAAHHREHRLLPHLAAAVPFDVPVPAFVRTTPEGRTWMAYRRLPGRALHAADSTAGLAPMLRALHDFPAATVTTLLGDSPDGADWRAEYLALRQKCERAHLFDHLDPAPRRRLERAWDDILDPTATPFFDPVLIHGDLAAQHILLDPASARPTGLIDFEGAALSDPATDFVGLLTTLGPAATRRILADYGDPIPWQRILLHWQLRAADSLGLALHAEDSAQVADCLAELHLRLTTEPN